MRYRDLLLTIPIHPPQRQMSAEEVRSIFASKRAEADRRWAFRPPEFVFEFRLSPATPEEEEAVPC